VDEGTNDPRTLRIRVYDDERERWGSPDVPAARAMTLLDACFRPGCPAGGPLHPPRTIRCSCRRGLSHGAEAGYRFIATQKRSRNRTTARSDSP